MKLQRAGGLGDRLASSCRSHLGPLRRVSAASQRTRGPFTRSLLEAPPTHTGVQLAQLPLSALPSRQDGLVPRGQRTRVQSTDFKYVFIDF